ncbi:MAG: DMT family transporter [Geminicoccaceae bacterium]
MAAAAVVSAAESSVARGIGFALLSYASFSTADAAVKVASGRLSVFEIAVFLAAFALLPIPLLTRGRGGIRALVPTHWKLVLARGVLTAICALCAWKAFALLPLADAYAILFASPILVTALSALVLKEHVGWRRWLAGAVGFAGVLIMIRPEFSTLGWGHVLGLTAAALGAVSFIVLRKIGGREPAAPILFTLFLCILLVSAPLAVPTWVWPTWHELSLLATAGLLQGAGQAAMVMATRNSPAAVVAPFQYTQMLWAMLFGAMLFGDMPQPIMFVGMILVVASGLYILWRETQRRRVVTLGAARGEVPARAAR